MKGKAKWNISKCNSISFMELNLLPGWPIVAKNGIIAKSKQEHNCNKNLSIGISIICHQFSLE